MGIAGVHNNYPMQNFSAWDDHMDLIISFDQ